jgi:hypothetical protein
MMHFSVQVNQPFFDKEMYVYGAFNNFEISEETKMEYDEASQSYQGNFLLKQGFYNYTFATVDTHGIADTNEVNGTFFETENEYTVLVYYKAFGNFYERVIGVGSGFFDQNR